MKRKALFSATIFIILIFGTDGFAFAQTTPVLTGYFVTVEGQPTGPHDTVGLRLLIDQGLLNRDTLVWREGMPAWVAAGTVEELASLLPAAFAPEAASQARQSRNREGEGRFALGVQAGARLGLLEGWNSGFYAAIYGAYAFTSFFSLQTGLAISFNDGESAIYSYGASSFSPFNISFMVLDISLLSTLTLRPFQNMIIRFSIGPMVSFVLSDVEFTILRPSTELIAAPVVNNPSFGVIAGIGAGYRIGRGNIVFDIRVLGSLMEMMRYTVRVHNFGDGRSAGFYRFAFPVLLLGYEIRF